MYDVYEMLRKKKGVTDYQVAKETGISRSAFSEWKKKKYSFKSDKLKKLADYFDVSVDYLMTGEETAKESESGKKYYFNDETAEIAQELYENPGQRILFDASRGAKQEDLQMAADLLRRLKGTNPDA